jgi:hypothetical protein
MTSMRRRAHLNLAWHRLDAWPDVRPPRPLRKTRLRPAQWPFRDDRSRVRNGFAGRDPALELARLQAEAHRPPPRSLRSTGPDEAKTAAPIRRPRPRVGCAAFIERPDEFGPGRGDKLGSATFDHADEHHSITDASACDFRSAIWAGCTLQSFASDFATVILKRRCAAGAGMASTVAPGTNHGYAGRV